MKRFLWLFGLAFLLAGCGETSVPSDGLFNIELAAYPALCVDVYLASTTEGEYVQPALCGQGLKSQGWQLTPVPSGGVTLANENSGLCMSVQNLPGSPDTAPGQDILQEHCNAPGTDPDQTWQIKPATGISGYWLVSAASGQCLNLPYGMLDPTDPSFHMQQNTCNAKDPAEAWLLEQTLPGTKP